MSESNWKSGEILVLNCDSSCNGGVLLRGES
jgi:hypothetical protein